MKKLITSCILTVLSLALWSATVVHDVPITDRDCCTLDAPANTTLEMLPGEWQKGFYASEPYLTFKDDGSYAIMDFSEAGYFINTGRWTLADDGTTLLLHMADGDFQAYTIKYLELDELVLSPVNRKGGDLYLNKL